jgi:hypothetical protein
MDRRFAFVPTTTRSFGVCLIASHPSAKNAEEWGARMKAPEVLLLGAKE